MSLREKHLGLWRDIPWAEYLEQVKFVALGLHALGVRRGDHVAIIGENRPEWLYSAMGVMACGATFVGVYTTNPAAECEYVVGHSDSVVYICEDEEQLDKALVFRDRTPRLRKLIVWEMEGLKHFQDPMFMGFDALLEMGKKQDRESPGLFEELLSLAQPEDVAGIIYTSGTTGPPKGAMITHECYIWVGRQANAVIQSCREDESISFLPLNHVYEQIFDLMMHVTVGPHGQFYGKYRYGYGRHAGCLPDDFPRRAPDLGKILFRNCAADEGCHPAETTGLRDGLEDRHPLQ